MKTVEHIQRLISGKIELDRHEYLVEVINDILVIKTKFLLNKSQNQKIVNNTIKIIPTAKGAPIYYAYIDKVLTPYYDCGTYHILLFFADFPNTNNVQFEIISKGLTNSINRVSSSNANPLSKIKNLNKQLFNTVIKINKFEYSVYFKNIAIKNKNNLCPADFTSEIVIKPMDNTFPNKIFDVFNFSIQLVQFLSLNTYPFIDRFIITNDVGGFSEIEMNYDTSKLDLQNDRFLSIFPFSKYMDRVLNHFPNVVPYRHNLYHYERDWIYEFDIVRMSGMFEWVFRELIEKEERYVKKLKKKKEEVHFYELSLILREFSKRHKLDCNDDFSFCKHLFDEYGGTLKNKLEYVLTDFCKTMNYIIIDLGVFYSPSKFETRLKNARNLICHGLYTNKIDWKNASNDTLILQELIYFMILKYKFKLPSGRIRQCIDSSFGLLNKSASLFKKNDKRLKIVD